MLQAARDALPAAVYNVVPPVHGVTGFDNVNNSCWLNVLLHRLLAVRSFVNTLPSMLLALETPAPALRAAFKRCMWKIDLAKYIFELVVLVDTITTEHLPASSELSKYQTVLIAKVRSLFDKHGVFVLQVDAQGLHTIIDSNEAFEWLRNNINGVLSKAIDCSLVPLTHPFNAYNFTWVK